MHVTNRESFRRKTERQKRSNFFEYIKKHADENAINNRNDEVNHNNNYPMTVVDFTLPGFDLLIDYKYTDLMSTAFGNITVGTEVYQYNKDYIKKNNLSEDKTLLIFEDAVHDLQWIAKYKTYAGDRDYKKSPSPVYSIWFDHLGYFVNIIENLTPSQNRNYKEFKKFAPDTRGFKFPDGSVSSGHFYRVPVITKSQVVNHHNSIDDALAYAAQVSCGLVKRHEVK
jgi:hypothetical protein